MFSSVLIGFLAGGAVASLAFGLYGNPRADQLESEVSFKDGKIEMLGFEIRNLKAINEDLQSDLAKSTSELMKWDEWSAGIPSRPQCFTAKGTDE